MAPTFLKLDIVGALQPALLDAVVVFFFLALFDSIGTLVGVAGRIGLAPDGSLPRVRQALLADAIGTVIGACLGTSTVTAYVESSTGVAAGGRTGLASVVTAALFLLALFFHPLVKMIGGGYAAGNGVVLYPIVAPALILVGVMMMESVRRIPLGRFHRGVPAFLAIVMMPLAFSITDGIAFGFIAYAMLKPATGRARELNPLGVRVCGALRSSLRVVVAASLRRASRWRMRSATAGSDQDRMDLLLTPADALPAELAGSAPPLLDRRAAGRGVRARPDRRRRAPRSLGRQPDRHERGAARGVHVDDRAPLLAARVSPPSGRSSSTRTTSGLRAARVFWLLEYLGHPNVRVLDGGFEAWHAAGARR